MYAYRYYSTDNALSPLCDLAMITVENPLPNFNWIYLGAQKELEKVLHLYIDRKFTILSIYNTFGAIWKHFAVEK